MTWPRLRSVGSASGPQARKTFTGVTYTTSPQFWKWLTRTVLDYAPEPECGRLAGLAYPNQEVRIRLLSNTHPSCKIEQPRITCESMNPIFRCGSLYQIFVVHQSGPRPTRYPQHHSTPSTLLRSETHATPTITPRKVADTTSIADRLPFVRPILAMT